MTLLGKRVVWATTMLGACHGLTWQGAADLRTMVLGVLKTVLVPAGALAGGVTGLLTTPLDVVKTRLMTQGNKQIYKGVFDCVSKISKEEGASTLLQASLHAHHRSASLPVAADLPASSFERAAEAFCHSAAPFATPCRSGVHV